MAAGSITSAACQKPASCFRVTGLTCKFYLHVLANGFLTFLTGTVIICMAIFHRLRYNTFYLKLFVRRKMPDFSLSERLSLQREKRCFTLCFYREVFTFRRWTYDECEQATSSVGGDSLSERASQGRDVSDYKGAHRHWSPARPRQRPHRP